MYEYVIYHLTSDGKTQNQSDAIASYTDLGAFLSAMDQLSNMVCSIRDRYVKEGNLDNLVKNPPIVVYSYFASVTEFLW